MSSARWSNDYGGGVSPAHARQGHKPRVILYVPLPSPAPVPKVVVEIELTFSVVLPNSVIVRWSAAGACS